MKSLSQNKGTLTAMIFFVLLVMLYKTFFQSDTQELINSNGQQIGASLVDTYLKLETVNFNQKLFSSEAYRELTDWSFAIPTQPVGRPNPFNAIGRD